MIDDATLAAWEQHADQITWNDGHIILACITEIRRLRQNHEWATNNITNAVNKIDVLKAALAAYRAVVRTYEASLASGLMCLAGQPCNDPTRDHRHWAQEEYIALTALIQQAREEPHA